MTQQLITDAELGRDFGDFYLRKSAPSLFLSHAFLLCIEVYGSVSIKMLHVIARNAPRNEIQSDGLQKGNDSPNSPTEKTNSILAEAGFNYLLRQEPAGEFNVGNPFREAIAILIQRVRDEVKNLTEEQKAADEDLVGFMPIARRLKDIDTFFYETLLKLNDDARRIVDLSVYSFLDSLLDDTSLYPTSADGTPLTLRAKYVIDIEIALADKIAAFSKT